MSEWIAGVKDRIAQEFQGQPWVSVMATVSSDGRPTARCMICQEIDNTGRLIFLTDRRANEDDYVRASSEIQLVFWLPSQQTQVRIKGSASVVDAETDVFMRETVWEQLSTKIQSIYTNNPAASGDGSTMPSTFELIVVAPRKVEVRELLEKPGEKQVWRDSSSEWATASAI